jgi:hypothetical protein
MPGETVMMKHRTRQFIQVLYWAVIILMITVPGLPTVLPTWVWLLFVVLPISALDAWCRDFFSRQFWAAFLPYNSQRRKAWIGR